jgi:hypothetical protein
MVLVYALKCCLRLRGLPDGLMAISKRQRGSLRRNALIAPRKENCPNPFLGNGLATRHKRLD